MIGSVLRKEALEVEYRVTTIAYGAELIVTVI
jgi:hypothetical protein